MRSKEVGEAIKKRREQVGLTQAGLADRLGVHPQTVVKYEAGAISVSIHRLGQIAQALDTSTGALMGEALDYPVNVPGETRQGDKGFEVWAGGGRLFSSREQELAFLEHLRFSFFQVLRRELRSLPVSLRERERLHVAVAATDALEEAIREAENKILAPAQVGAARQVGAEGSGEESASPRQSPTQDVERAARAVADLPPKKEPPAQRSRRRRAGSEE